MAIRKCDFDLAFPFIIEDTWGYHCSYSLEDLKKLKNEIEEILKQEEKE